MPNDDDDECDIREMNWTSSGMINGGLMDLFNHDYQDEEGHTSDRRSSQGKWPS